MRNSQRLEAATKGMDPVKKAAFENCFIGAISVLCKKEDWEEALKTAADCVEKYFSEKDPVFRG